MRMLQTGKEGYLKIVNSSDIMPEEESPSLDSMIEQSISFLRKHTVVTILVVVLLVGMGLRYLAVTHVAPLADEMIHGTHAIGIIKAGVINLQNQGPLWSYLTDLAYLTFGVNGFSARSLSFFFGTLTILMVYLIGRQLFTPRIALIAAILLAFSAFHIRYALMEMDEAMIFFVLFAYYCFVKELRETKKISLLAFASLGIAILIKPIAIPFLPGFIFVYYLTMPRSEQISVLKLNRKRIVFSGLILFLFSLPVLAFNYILYQQKGITDVLFARFFGISQEIYAGLQGYDHSFSISYLLNSGILSFLRYLFLPHDPLIFIFGVIGITLFFVTKKHEAGRSITLFHMVPFIFLLGTSLLPTHFVSFMPVLCLGAAIFIDRVAERMKTPDASKKMIIAIIAAIILVNLFILFPTLSSTSAFFQMRSYAQNNIGENDVVVADTRIYRGRIAWMFNDKAYVEAAHFEQLFQLNENLSGIKKPTTVYYIECVYQDDCGWGTIKDQPSLNASMEHMTLIFRNASREVITLYGGGGYGEDTREPYFRIYKVTINLSPQVFPAIYETHDWFYYPVRWAKSDWYDRYTPQGLFQVLLHLIGKTVLWIAVFGSFLIAFWVIRIFVQSLPFSERDAFAQ